MYMGFTFDDIGHTAVTNDAFICSCNPHYIISDNVQKSCFSSVLSRHQDLCRKCGTEYSTSQLWYFGIFSSRYYELRFGMCFAFRYSVGERCQWIALPLEKLPEPQSHWSYRLVIWIWVRGYINLINQAVIQITRFQNNWIKWLAFKWENGNHFRIQSSI